MHYIIWLLINRAEISIKPIVSLFTVNTSGYHPIAGAQWFLTALFFADVMYSFLIKRVKDSRILTVMIATIALGGNVWTLIMTYQLPWGERQLL